MAQEFESQFKPIVSGSDYLSGSEFGQVAGALLARRDKQDKKQAKRALLASAVLEGLGALQRNQKQGVIDSINETNEKYSDVFRVNQEEYSRFNRKEVDEYIKNPENFINKKAIEKFNTSDFAVNNGVTYQNRNNESVVIQEGILTTLNNYKKEIKQEYDILKENPIYQKKSFSEFNRKAKEEYMAAVNAIKDDPTKKGLLRAAFNKVFGTAPDGTKRFGMAEQAELENTLKEATQDRTTFRAKINKSEEDLQNFYQGIMPSEASMLNLSNIKNTSKIFSVRELEDKTNSTIKLFVDDRGNYTSFGKTGLEFNISGEAEDGSKFFKTVDIKNKIRNNNIVVLNENGEKEPLSQNILYESIALKTLNMQHVAITENKEQPLTGPTAVHAVLESFNENNRFRVEGNKIIFTPPGSNIKDEIDADDAAALLQTNGKPEEELPSDVLQDDSITTRYSAVSVLNFVEDLRLEGKSDEEINLAVTNMKVNVFKNDKDISKEIDLIVNSTKEEFLKLKKLELEERGESSIFPTKFFRNEFGTVSDIDKLLGK